MRFWITEFAERLPSRSDAPPLVFAGQIVDADIYFRNDGQAIFATRGALAVAPGAYDLESLLRWPLRSLDPDPADTKDIAYITGRVLSANSFAMGDFLAAAPRQYLTGMIGWQVVAVDSAAGSVFAATLGGWRCAVRRLDQLCTSTAHACLALCRLAVTP